MEKQAIKDLIYGSLSELIQNSKYYNNWSVQRPFTPEGEKVLIEFFNSISKVIIRISNEELDRKSKEMVLNALKDENK